MTTRKEAIRLADKVACPKHGREFIRFCMENGAEVKKEIYISDLMNSGEPCGADQIYAFLSKVQGYKIYRIVVTTKSIGLITEVL